MITKDMKIADVLSQYPQTAGVFLSLGMHCLGCPSATQESVGEAALSHGCDPDKLVTDLEKEVQK